MRVLLISANTEGLNMPTLPLGLAYVAASTRKAGHEVRYLDLMAQEDAQAVIKKIVQDLRPDVVGISVRNIDDQDMANPDFLMVRVTTGIRIYPHTLLARIAVEEGYISAEDNLLKPRFYLARGLEEWLPETVESWMDARPNWVS